MKCCYIDSIGLPECLSLPDSSDKPIDTLLPQKLFLWFESCFRQGGNTKVAVQSIRYVVKEVRSWLEKNSLDRVLRKQIEHVLLKFELRLISHGVGMPEEADALICSYVEFKKKHSGAIYDSLFSWIEDRIDDDLYIAQAVYFNTFRFEEVEDTLSTDISMYLSIISSIKDYDLNNNFCKDALYAKLNGTIGQALGFMAFSNLLSQNEDYVRSAVKYLQSDVEALDKGTWEWIQGVNYVTSLEWAMRRPNQAIRWLSESLCIEKPIEPHDLFRLHGDSALVPDSYPQASWILLNQLRVLSLCLHDGSVSGMEKTYLVSMISKYFRKEDLAYPNNLIMKWLMFLSWKAGVVKDALVQEAETYLFNPRSSILLELMRSNEYFFLASITESRDIQDNLWESGRRIMLNLESKSSLELYFRFSSLRLLCDKQRFLGLNPYDVATALPYYYS